MDRDFRLQAEESATLQFLPLKRRPRPRTPEAHEMGTNHDSYSIAKREDAGGGVLRSARSGSWRSAQSCTRSLPGPQRDTREPDRRNAAAFCARCSAPAVTTCGCSRHFSATTAQHSSRQRSASSISIAWCSMCAPCASATSRCSDRRCRSIRPRTLWTRRCGARARRGSQSRSGRTSGSVAAPSSCPGVTIGSRTVIGAGSVVTRDIPDDVFAGGNPCRVVKSLVVSR